jgi:1-acyl-sn-glycerol-3-phosphate acyltransferase
VFKPIKIFFIAIWNVWFYILAFIGIVISLPLLFIFSLKESYYPYFYWVARNIWSNTIMYGMGFYPEIKFKEPIQKGKSYMLVANHKSMIDIMLMLSVSKDPIVFVGKKELEKIPVFGYFYRRVCILVDRSSAESRKDVYAKAIKRLETGLSVCIFPEGGVPDPTVVLDEFKNGAFSLAIQFQIPIVPMTFLDCEKKFPYFFAYNHFVGSPGKLRANVHNFVETKGLNQEDRQMLKKKVYDILLEDLESNLSQN